MRGCPFAGGQPKWHRSCTAPGRDLRPRQPPTTEVALRDRLPHFHYRPCHSPLLPAGRLRQRGREEPWPGPAEAANGRAGRCSRPSRPVQSSCSGGGTRAGIGSEERHWPPAHHRQKNDGSREAQKALGETPALLAVSCGPAAPKASPAGVRSSRWPRPAERGPRHPRPVRQRLPRGGSRPPPLVMSLVTSGAP